MTTTISPTHYLYYGKHKSGEGKPKGVILCDVPITKNVPKYTGSPKFVTCIECIGKLESLGIGVPQLHTKSKRIRKPQPLLSPEAQKRVNISKGRIHLNDGRGNAVCKMTAHKLADTAAEATCFICVTPWTGS